MGAVSFDKTSLPKTAFGELSVAHNETQFSVMHTVGFDPSQSKKWIGPGGGTVTASTAKPGMLEVLSGTTAGAVTKVRSTRALYYRPGRGALLRMTGIFGSPVAGTRQFIGGLSFLNGFAFGYDEDGNFGVCRRHDGAFEIWALTVTGAATGAETATITIDGTPYTVNLTAGTTAFNAAQIQASLQTQLASLGYIVTNTGSVVAVANAYDYSALGSMAFAISIGGTATASWSRTKAGAEPQHDWVYRADWNGNQVPWFDPTKGNVYEINFQYLGFGDIYFRMVDPGTGEWVTVHTIRWGGSNTQLSLPNPNLFATWAVDNVTNSTAVTMYAGCAWGAIQGQSARANVQVHNFTKAAVSTSETYLFALRNDIATADLTAANQSSFRLAKITAVTDSGKGARVRVHKFATLTNPQWVNHTTTGYNLSHVSYDTSATAFALTNAVDVTELLLGPNGSDTWALGSLEDTIPVYPNETLVVTGYVLAGAASAIDVTVTWDEQR